jgi:hypothetical protein
MTRRLAWAPGASRTRSATDSGGLKELDDVAGRVYADDLLPALLYNDLVPELDTKLLELGNVRFEIV